MILRNPSGAHLTYCTNIHSGETVSLILENLRTHVLAVKENIAPREPFGLGLWLPKSALDELRATQRLSEFKTFLDDHDLYLFTLNAFPYGAFHAASVKEKVYLPDFLDDARLDYTLGLAEIMTKLSAGAPVSELSISTIPGAFRPRVRGEADEILIANNLIRAAAALHSIERETGVSIALALEPEPFCFLESTTDAVAFFKNRLFCNRSVRALAKVARIDEARAETALARHIGLCYDACHFAVGFEDPAQSLHALENAGIRIAKVQVSAGLEITELTPDALAALAPFAEGTYLHQVSEKKDGTLKRFLDLPDALRSVGSDFRGKHWRIHFHVPLQGDLAAPLRSTRAFTEELLSLLKQKRLMDHYEVETYTWDVLPPECRNVPVEEMIARDLEWVRQRLAS